MIFKITLLYQEEYSDKNQKHLAITADEMVSLVISNLIRSMLQINSILGK
jgi:phosphatidylglycerophosphatase A